MSHIRPTLTITKAQAHDYLALTNIWERSVRATHDFLTESAILDIRNDVFDISLRAMDVHVAFLVWDVPQSLSENLPENSPSYPLPQKLETALSNLSNLSNDLLVNEGAHGSSLEPDLAGGDWQKDSHEVRRTPLGFLGVQESHIAMLFIDQPYHRLGLGEMLIRYALGLGVNSVNVNEQNPNAFAFYSKMGFTQYDRSPLDAQGNPFPILHLRFTG